MWSHHFTKLRIYNRLSSNKVIFLILHSTARSTGYIYATSIWQEILFMKEQAFETVNIAPVNIHKQNYEHSSAFLSGRIYVIGNE